MSSVKRSLGDAKRLGIACGKSSMGTAITVTAQSMILLASITFERGTFVEPPR